MGFNTTKPVYAALAANLGIFTVKAVSAVISGSAAMFSEALHSLADTMNSLFLLVGIIFSRRPPDKEHPFGYGKEIYFWSFVASIFMLGVTSMGSLYKGYQQFTQPEPVGNVTLAVIALITALVFESISLFVAFKGVLANVGIRARSINIIFQALANLHRISNPAMKLVFLEDSVALVAAVLALAGLWIVKLTGHPEIDGLISLAIGTILAILALLLASENRAMIIGRSASRSVEERIAKLALEIPEVRDVFQLKTMHVGPRAIVVNMEVEVDPDLKVEEVDDIVSNVEEHIRMGIPGYQYCSIKVRADLRTKK